MNFYSVPVNVSGASHFSSEILFDLVSQIHPVIDLSEVLGRAQYDFNFDFEINRQFILSLAASLESSLALPSIPKLRKRSHSDLVSRVFFGIWFHLSL